MLNPYPKPQAEYSKKSQKIQTTEQPPQHPNNQT